MSGDKPQPDSPGAAAGMSRTTGTSGSGRGARVTGRRGESVTSGESCAWTDAAGRERHYRERALLRAELARLAGDLSIPVAVDMGAHADSELSAPVRAIFQRRLRRPGEGEAGRPRTTSRSRTHSHGERSG